MVAGLDTALGQHGAQTNAVLTPIQSLNRVTRPGSATTRLPRVKELLARDQRPDHRNSELL